MFKVKFLLEEHLKGVFLSINNSNTSIYSKIIGKNRKGQSLWKCSKDKKNSTYKNELNKYINFFPSLISENKYYGKVKSCVNCYTNSYIIYNNKNNKLISTTYENNMLNNIIQYINKKRNGTQINFDQYFNSVEVTNWVNGVMNGIEIIYLENGNIDQICNWLNGKKNGIEIEYFENGNIEQICNWINGEKNGKQIRYFENGNICEICNWLNGKENGEDIEYFENCNKKKVVEWLKDKKNGKEITYFKSSNKQYEFIWLNGKKMAKKW